MVVSPVCLFVAIIRSFFHPSISLFACHSVHMLSVCQHKCLSEWMSEWMSEWVYWYTEPINSIITSFYISWPPGDIGTFLLRLTCTFQLPKRQIKDVHFANHNGVEYQVLLHPSLRSATMCHKCFSVSTRKRKWPLFCYDSLLITFMHLSYMSW